MPRLALGNWSVLSAQCRAATLGPIVCIATSVQISTLLRSRSFTSPQRHPHSLCFERNMHVSLHCGKLTGKNLCLSRNRLAAGLTAWESGSQTGLLILLKSHHRNQHILSHASGRMRPFNKSSDWDILALWCDALALKPGRGWDSMEPSQVQKLSSLEGNL